MTEIRLAAVIESIPGATAFIEEQLEALGCSMRAQMQIDVAIYELFCNIASYAYGDGTGEATVRFDYDAPTRTAAITFVDRGVPFNPLEQAEPDVTLAARDRKIGGLGIHLVRKTMDRMEYRREDGQNILTIYKRI